MTSNAVTLAWSAAQRCPLLNCAPPSALLALSFGKTQEEVPDSSAILATPLIAAKSKDLKALVTANGQLVDTCEQCHKEFKPDLPTEEIVPTHAH